MPSFSQKKTYIVLVGILLVVIFMVINNPASPSIPPDVQSTSTPVVTSTEPSLTFGQITRQERIDHVNWTYTNNMKYPEIALNEKETQRYVTTFYQWQSATEKGKGGGMLIFSIISGEPKLIWESDPIPAYIRLFIKTVDTTGDGIKEVLALWQSQWADGLYVYQKEGNSFRLISPLCEDDFITCFNSEYGSTQIDDIDDDTIPEVWFRYIDAYKAYKWDGTKYFLWKQQNEPFGELKNFTD